MYLTEIRLNHQPSTAAAKMKANAMEKRDIGGVTTSVTGAEAQSILYRGPVSR